MKSNIIFSRGSDREGVKDNTLVVLLIPARTDTKYFHDSILNRSEIRYVKIWRRKK